MIYFFLIFYVQPVVSQHGPRARWPEMSDDRAACVVAKTLTALILTSCALAAVVELAFSYP